MTEDREKRGVMGRPHQAPETLRRNRVVTMVTDSELEKLSAVAATENKSLSGVVRDILSKSLEEQK